MKKSYKSFSANLFIVWTSSFYSFIFLWIGLGIILENGFLGFSIGVPIGLLVGVILFFSSYTTVTYEKNILKTRSLTESHFIENPIKIESWWNYEQGDSSYEISQADTDKMRAHINKKNVYVKFSSEKGSLYIFEQIHMSEKFPNDHPYNESRFPDKSK